LARRPSVLHWRQPCGQTIVLELAQESLLAALLEIVGVVETRPADRNVVDATTASDLRADIRCLREQIERVENPLFVAVIRTGNDGVRRISENSWTLIEQRHNASFRQ